MTQEKGEIAGAKSLMGERESGTCMQCRDSPKFVGPELMEFG